MMKENRSTIAAFVDVASAYDNVRRNVLINELRERNVQEIW